MGYALLIDDDVLLSESISRVAAGEGLELTTAGSWDDGMRVFLAEAPTLVICDYNLPGSKLGLKLLRELASLRASARLVLISAFLNEADVTAIMDLGFSDRVVRKTRPVETARAILGELRDARDRATMPTDWQAFGSTNLRRAEVDPDALEKLDAYLQSNRLPKAGGR